MKNDWLFPHCYRRIGWLLFFPSACLGLVDTYGEYLPWLRANLTWLYALPSPSFLDGDLIDEVAALGIIAGLLLVAFARERTEDEMIRQLRLVALQWSVYINYGLLALAIVLLYDIAFFHVMIYNMFTILLVFIGRFRWSLRRLGQEEKQLA